MQVAMTGKYSCEVCGKGVGSNSVKCTSANAWIHKKCSGITGKVTRADGFRCRRCIGGNHDSMKVLQQVLLGNGQCFECVERFF